MPRTPSRAARWGRDRGPRASLPRPSSPGMDDRPVARKWLARPRRWTLHHVNAGKAGRPAQLDQSGTARRPPGGPVTVQLAGGEELPNRVSLQRGNVDRLALDHGPLSRNGTDPSHRGQRILEVIDHPEEQDDVEGAETGEVHSHEILDHRLDLAVERRSGHVESPLARK